MLNSPTHQVAFFVDGDNLTGQGWESLINHARAFGHLAIARLYMDFQVLSDGGMASRTAGFEPVHVLGKRTSVGFKSMVDVALATDSMSVLYENPNITTFIIGTGDADFIPLIRQWKRRGKNVVVMSNEAKLSTDLRQVADELVTFKGGRAKKPRAVTASKLGKAQLRDLVLEIAGRTRLTDRETNQPLVRVDWMLEELHEHYPETEQELVDENALIKLIAELPELVPIDGKQRTYLIGNVEVTKKAKTGDAKQQSMSDEQVMELFGELCREVLPSDGSWLGAPIVLNEGKRLLEDGAGFELPSSRQTGWFRSLMERTAGVLVRINEQGHMELRRGE